MSDHDAGTAVAVGFGIGFVLGGIALLLQELGMLALRWSVVVPVVLVTTGLVVVVTGLVGAHHARPGRVAAQHPE